MLDHSMRKQTNTLCSVCVCGRVFMNVWVGVGVGGRREGICWSHVQLFFYNLILFLKKNSHTHSDFLLYPFFLRGRGSDITILFFFQFQYPTLESHSTHTHTHTSSPQPTRVAGRISGERGRTEEQKIARRFLIMQGCVPVSSLTNPS